MKNMIINLLICILLIISGIAIAENSENNPPNIPSNPHPRDESTDIGIKTHLSWTGGDPDAGDKAIYDLYIGTGLNPDLIASNLEKPNYYAGVLEHNNSYYWYVVAKDENGASTTGPEWTFKTNNCTCDPPEKPSGPTRARNRHRYEYSTKIMNQSQNGWYFNFSWGEGNHSGWIGPYNYNERVRAENQWEEPGVYQVQVRARFMQNNRSINDWVITGWSESLFVTVSTNNPNNDPPNIPEINGQSQGKPGVEYDYDISATDPDSDDIYYHVNWGCCGDEIHEFGPYASGEEIVLSHIWPEQGDYIIQLKAVDVYGLESDWATFEISIPKTKSFNFRDFLINFLEDNPLMFPVLRQLLGLN